MPSIVDVAKLAGVSVTTVSRVINNSAHPVNAKTRALVLQAAEALHYVPSALARALVSDETHIIGVIVGDAADPYFATIIRGISDVAREQGYLIITCNSDRVPEIELHYVRLLRDYHADGIIFAGGGLVDPVYLEQMKAMVEMLQESKIPILALGHHLFESPQVNIDNALATQEMTEYLIQIGHRSIALVAGPSVLITSEMRMEGYRRALKRYGLPFIQQLVIESDFTYESGQRAADELLTRQPLPTAIFCSNDIVAIGCITQLKVRGVQVPGQISVVGIDDIDAAQYIDPPLTTIRVPMREMGEVGMSQLLRLIVSKEPIDQLYLLPHRLVIRASSAPLASDIPTNKED